jgi:hypothetical protein
MLTRLSYVISRVSNPARSFINESTKHWARAACSTIKCDVCSRNVQTEEKSAGLALRARQQADLPRSAYTQVSIHPGQHTPRSAYMDPKTVPSELQVLIQIPPKFDQAIVPACLSMELHIDAVRRIVRYNRG